MNIELLISADDGKSAFMPYVKSIEWRTEISCSPGRLVCCVLWDGELKASEGASVRLRADGRNVFFGYLFGSERGADGELRLICYDQLRYLLNKDTYIYEGKTASQLLRLIAEDFSLKIGTVEDSGYVIPYRIEENSTLLDMMENAISLTYHNGGGRFVLYDDFGSLCLKSIRSFYGGDKVLLIDEGAAEELALSSSVDKNAYNTVKLFYNGGKSGKRDIYTAQDREKVRKWGVLQYTESLRAGENGEAKAKELLRLYNRKKVKAEVKNAFGDTAFRAGCIGAVSLGGEKGFMLAERVIHKFTPEGHFMDVILTEI